MKLMKQGVRNLDPTKQTNHRRKPDKQIAGHLYKCPECKGVNKLFCKLCWGLGVVEHEVKR